MFINIVKYKPQILNSSRVIMREAPYDKQIDISHLCAYCSMYE